MHRKILKFRAFLLAHGIDTDYTTAINLLADYGFDELLNSEFTVGLLGRLGNQAALDESTREAISKDWLEGKMPDLGTGARESSRREGRAQATSTAQSPPLARKKQEQVQAHCIRCKVSRQMRDPSVVTLKNGRKAVQGKCPVCGSKMFRLGPLH